MPVSRATRLAPINCALPHSPRLESCHGPLPGSSADYADYADLGIKRLAIGPPTTAAARFLLDRAAAFGRGVEERLTNTMPSAKVDGLVFVSLSFNTRRAEPGAARSSNNPRHLRNPRMKHLPAPIS